jgi:hypothetical protein
VIAENAPNDRVCFNIPVSLVHMVGRVLAFRKQQPSASPAADVASQLIRKRTEKELQIFGTQSILTLTFRVSQFLICQHNCKT